MESIGTSGYFAIFSRHFVDTEICYRMDCADNSHDEFTKQC